MDVPVEQAWLPEPARNAVAVYRARFADERHPVTVAWAPGRANLIGEHTDYNDGYVLPVAIDRVVSIAGIAQPGGRTTLYSYHHDQRRSFASSRAALLAGEPPAHGPLWRKYVRGILRELAEMREAPATPAFMAAITGNVPVGGGMSSSAALDVAVATFAAALGGPALDPLETALLCQRSDARSVGIRSGIMDQAISCLGRPDHALLLDCRSLAHEYVPVDLPDLAIAVFDTRVPHTLANSGYNERRRQCEEATAILAAAIAPEQPDRQITALRDITRADLDRHGYLLPETLLRRARHVVSENGRVLEAVQALRSGEAEALGRLVYASHASLRDDYAVSCPELDTAVDIAATVPGVWGARMMGAGFGGSALVLVRQSAVDDLRRALDSQYTQRTGRIGHLHICRVSGGPQYATIALDIS